MAISINPLFKGMRGSINKQIVVKQYAHKTVVTKYPDMSRVVLSPQQKQKNEVFAEAVKYAQSILSDPEKCREYRKSLKPGQRVYNQAIKAYLASVKDENIQPSNTEDEAYQYGRWSLSIRRMKPIRTNEKGRIRPPRGLFQPVHQTELSGFVCSKCVFIGPGYIPDTIDHSKVYKDPRGELIINTANNPKVE
jgi:hypothetical protein